MNKEVLKEIFLHGVTHADMSSFPIVSKDCVSSYDESSIYDYVIGEKNMKKYEIRVQWITNDFVTVNRVYDYAGKEFSFVLDEFNLISNQLYDLMNKGKIKTYQAHIAW